MSADARVARAIQQVRALQADRDEYGHDPNWQSTFYDAVDELIDEAKDALRLTDSDIAQY